VPDILNLIQDRHDVVLSETDLLPPLAIFPRFG